MRQRCCRSLAIVCNVFPVKKQARALGVWAGISAAGAGDRPARRWRPLVEVDWRVIFWINLPIAVVAIAIMALSAPESTDPGSGRRIDFPGLLALSLGLTAAVLALVQARVWSVPVSLVVRGHSRC